MATEVERGSPRLPTTVLPKAYRIILRPDLVAHKYTGDVEIDVDVREAASRILINSEQLELLEAIITPQDTQAGITASGIEYYADESTAALTFPSDVPVGTATLSIKFNGILNDQMKGFYRSSYVKDGVERTMAVTQFEPAEARRAFPCWDEPALKATFEVTVVAPSDRVVLGNMPVEAEETLPAAEGEVPLRSVKFQKSPIMSTYLVAVVVGEFDYISAFTTEGTEVRVYTEVGKTEQGKFALDVAVQTLPFFAEYFGTPYPLPKMDMVAIPDFAAGAMENYGLVTYRSVALLVDPKGSSSLNKQRVAITVTHELAHQWFGNLVTMVWWDALFLNEAFATWISYLATDYLFPDWQVWTQFVNSDWASAMSLDALKESHPVEVEVDHVRKIDEIFDLISYQKGASILRMLQTYLGADTFRDGLRQYIAKFEYANAAPNDLWESLGRASDKPVAEMMTTWTKQTGYPVINLTLAEDTISLAQDRFLSSGEKGDGQWIVPITAIPGSVESPIFIFHMEEKTASFPVPVAGLIHNPDVWCKINAGQAGFYRVQYPPSLLAPLLTAVTKKVLPPQDRLGILDDAYALSRAGKQPLGALLHVLQAYGGEDDYTVVCSLAKVVSAVLDVLGDASAEFAQDFKIFARRLIAPAAARLGWAAAPGEAHLVSLERGVVLDLMVTLEDPTTLSEARKRFDAFVADKATPLLPADLRRMAYRAVAKGAGGLTSADGFKALIAQYEAADLSEERNRLLVSLGEGSDPAVIVEALDYALTPAVRKQDAWFVPVSVSKAGRDVHWKWFQGKWTHLWGEYGSGFLITRFVQSAARFSSEDKAAEVRAFFNSVGTPSSIARTVEQSIERITSTARWVADIRTEANLGALLQQIAAPPPAESAA